MHTKAANESQEWRLKDVSERAKDTERVRDQPYKQLHCSQSVFVIAHQFHEVILPLALIPELFDAFATDWQHMENAYVSYKKKPM